MIGFHMPAVSGGGRRAKATKEAIPQRQYGSTLPLLNSQPWADSQVYICLLGGKYALRRSAISGRLACTMSSSSILCVSNASLAVTPWMSAYDKFSVCEAEATRDHRQ